MESLYAPKPGGRRLPAFKPVGGFDRPRAQREEPDVMSLTIGNRLSPHEIVALLGLKARLPGEERK